jgi:hypothetical protein
VARSEIDEQLKAVGGNGMDLIREKFGGTRSAPFRRAIKEGRQDSSYMIELTSGEMVRFGTDLSQENVFKRMRDATNGHYVPPTVKNFQWKESVVQLAKYAEEVSREEGEDCQRFEELLRPYLDSVVVYEPECFREAYPESHPFRHKGLLHINVYHWQAWLEIHRRSVKAEEHYLRSLLRQAGFRTKLSPLTVRIDSKVIARSYWSGEEPHCAEPPEDDSASERTASEDKAY